MNSRSVDPPLVLVTGAAGRIGRAVTNDLAGRYRWRLFDRVAVGRDELPVGAEERIGDITDAAAVADAMAGVDAVLHLAGVSSARASLDEAWGPNVEGTRIVLDAAIRNGVRRVVLAGSNRVVEAHSPLRNAAATHDDRAVAPGYGNGPTAGVELGVDVAFAPDGPYGTTKAVAELLAAEAVRAASAASAAAPKAAVGSPETTIVTLRLGSVDVGVVPSIEDKPRAWALWLSRRDLAGVVAAALDAALDTPLDSALDTPLDPALDAALGSAMAPTTAAGLGCRHVVAYACSANTRRWWDLSVTERVLGYRPVDDSERFLHRGHRARTNAAANPAENPAEIPAESAAARAFVPPPPPYALPWGPRLAALTSDPGRAFLVAIGQSGFVLVTPGRRVAVDPFLTMRHDRLQAPLLDPSALVVDDVFVTHTHRDHLDAPALERLAAAQPHTRFVGPPTVAARLAELAIEPHRIVTVEPGRTVVAGDVTATVIDARHRPTTPDAVGYVLRCAAGAVYHTGDTELDGCLLAARAHRPDVLLVPVNGRKGNMTAEQAADLTADLGVPVVVPMHYGCLQPEDDLVDRFLARCAHVAPGAVPARMDPGAIASLPFARADRETP